MRLRSAIPGGPSLRAAGCRWSAGANGRNDRLVQIELAVVLVVDVSVEVALLARLCGVPTIYMRQRGNRFDPAHSLAYACASRLLAPYPEQLEEPHTPAEWSLKTDYAGSISRYSGTPQRQIDNQHVTVITGFGGTELTVARLAEAAHKCHDWQWTVLGPI